MSIEDGNKINESFIQKNKKIDSLKLTLDSAKFYHNQYMIMNGQRLQTMYNSWASEYYGRIADVDSLKMVIEANKRIYLKAEDRYKSQIKNGAIYTVMITFLAMLLSISN